MYITGGPFHRTQGLPGKGLDAQRRLTEAHADGEAWGTRLQRALERTMEPYKWGDIDRERYQAETREGH